MHIVLDVEWCPSMKRDKPVLFLAVVKTFEMNHHESLRFEMKN